MTLTYLHNTCKLFHFILPREEGVPGVELCQDAPETPHVNRHAVLMTQDDLRRAVEAALDVSVHWKTKTIKLLAEQVEIRKLLEYQKNNPRLSQGQSASRPLQGQRHQIEVAMAGEVKNDLRCFEIHRLRVQFKGRPTLCSE